MEELQILFPTKKIGDTIRVEFYREGNTKTIEVKLEAAPSQ
jgi:S1-C subfamily serine protease